MSNFTNKVADVPGGAQGIGAATALKPAGGGPCPRRRERLRI